MCWYTLGTEDVSLFLAILPEKKTKKKMHEKSDVPFPGEVQRKVRKEGVNFLVGMFGL